MSHIHQGKKKKTFGKGEVHSKENYEGNWTELCPSHWGRASHWGSWQQFQASYWSEAGLEECGTACWWAVVLCSVCIKSCHSQLGIKVKHCFCWGMPLVLFTLQCKNQCCQLGEFITRSGNFLAPFGDLNCQKQQATNLASFFSVFGRMLALTHVHFNNKVMGKHALGSYL